MISGKSFFIFYNSKGTPIELLLLKLKENGFIVEWLSFIEEALKNNWNVSNLFTMLENTFYFIYDKEYSIELIKRLKIYINNKDKQ